MPKRTIRTGKKNLKQTGLKTRLKKKKVTKKVTRKITKKFVINKIDERKKAKSIGLNLIQFRILKILKDGKSRSYQDIKDEIFNNYGDENKGYYNALTIVLHPEKENSLGDYKLVKLSHLESSDGSGRSVMHYTITAKGKNKLKKISIG